MLACGTPAVKHTVVVCGPVVRTQNFASSYYGPDCFWFRISPGQVINTTIDGKLGLQETQGFKVVNPGGVEAVDNHPVTAAPLQMGYSDDQDSTPMVCNSDGCSSPSPGITKSAAPLQPNGNLPDAVPIDIGSACKWAYPNRANGSWTGGVYNIQCLDSSGSILGGFNDGSGHSLNDWCADPAHTDGNSDLRQAMPATNSPTSWQCIPIGQ
jgi:hypothetical protein